MRPAREQELTLFDKARPLAVARRQLRGRLQQLLQFSKPLQCGRITACLALFPGKHRQHAHLIGIAAVLLQRSRQIRLQRALLLKLRLEVGLVGVRRRERFLDQRFRHVQSGIGLLIVFGHVKLVRFGDLGMHRFGGFRAGRVRLLQYRARALSAP